MIRILQQDNRIIKIIFAVIILLAVGTMVITLVPGIFDNAATVDANNFATVREPGTFGKIVGDSTPVKMTEVNQLAQRQLQQQKLPPFLLPYMANRAGEILVQRAILQHEADRLHLQVSDNDLRRELQFGRYAQIFFPGGKFIGEDAYMNLISNQAQISVGEFETGMKHDMELSRLQALITGGVSVSDNAVREAYRVQGTKVKFDYAALTSEQVGKGINPTDSDLQTFFKQNQARYATAIPETRKLQYVSFDASNLPGGKPQVTDADLQAYYGAHQAQFQMKAQVKVRHILIASPKGADAKTDASAKAKADDLLQQIKSGGDFAALATKNSDDPGSKVAGGELGWLDPGKTVPEFDKTAFSLAPGQTSGVIKTQFGYHILQVEDKKTAHLRTLAEVKPEILPVLEQQKAGGAEQSFAQQLSDQAKKEGLDKMAAAHGLHAVTTDYLGKEGVIGGVADSATMLTQAFNAAKGATPAAVATGDGYAIFQVLDVKAAHAPDFNEYKPHLLTDYREQQVPQMLSAQLNKLADRARVLNDLRKAAAEMSIPVKTSDLVGKDAQVPDLGAMSGPAAVAFSLPRGGISGPLNAGRVGAVLSVLEKQEPTPEDSAKNFAATKDELLTQQHEEIFRVYIGNLTTLYEKSGAVKYAKKQPAPGSSPFGT